MARRCLETVTLDGQVHTCVVLSSEGLSALRQENQVLKNMGYPVLNNLITTFGDVWVDSRDLYNTDAYSQVVNGSDKLRNFLEGAKTDSTRRNGIMLNGTAISYDNTSANYPYNGLYRGFVVDDDTKESWVLGGVVAITAYGNSALASNYYSSPAVYCALMNMAFDASNGGGATHIAKVTGQLSSLSNNLSDILMVSGGGGGGLLVDDTDYSGKEAGGISGSGDNSANQSTGYAFGQGESETDISGGGSGLYGGYKGTSAKSGGAGSGYIGNSLLSNKKMVGYNVPTSEAESTKTESVNEASESPVSGKPKIGNGHVKIKFLRELVWKQIELPTDNQVVLKPSDNSDWQLQNIPEQTKAPYMYRDDLIIVTGQSNCVNLQKNDNYYTYPYNDVTNFNSRYYYYLGGMKKHIISGKVKYRNTSGNHFPRLEVRLYNSYTNEIPAIISISSGTISQDFIDGEKIFDSEIEADYLLIRGALDSFDFKDIEILCD